MEMLLQQRLILLERLGHLLLSQDESWETVKNKASYENPWFTPEFINYQIRHIATEFLSPDRLRQWTSLYHLPENNSSPKNIGVVMAGNIPLAGFHDFLSVFISGHRQTIKPSSKDFHLINGIIQILTGWDEHVKQWVTIAERLKGCDAYIATGSNNSGRYFDYYFARFPHIIRRNRTSAAILTGSETAEQLEGLADDVHLYFGLGCRNVTKIYVPRNYEFLPLLDALRKYDLLADTHKYKNNYDYQLAIMIINRIYYMTNGSILLQENTSLFSPISQLNYEFYDDPLQVEQSLLENPDIQCVVSENQVAFGQAQRPALTEYADKADTLQFLRDL